MLGVNKVAHQRREVAKHQVCTGDAGFGTDSSKIIKTDIKQAVSRLALTRLTNGQIQLLEKVGSVEQSCQQVLG